MIHGKKVIVVLPAYKAAKTVKQTYDAIPMDVVDKVILVDDASSDDTAAIASELGIETHVHPVNRGYGGNQKTCYTQSLASDGDIVVMLHPDYQYDPRLVTAMAAMIASGIYDCVLGSRILGNTARGGGMPMYKYMANRFLTASQNLLMGTKLSEFHSGYRAFSADVMRKLPLNANSDDFVFDNQMLAQVAWHGFSMGEISCPTKYFPEASSINFKRSCIYGLGVLKTSVHFRLAKMGLASKLIFENPEGLLPALRSAD